MDLPLFNGSGGSIRLQAGTYTQNHEHGRRWDYGVVKLTEGESHGEFDGAYTIFHDSSDVGHETQRIETSGWYHPWAAGETTKTSWREYQLKNGYTEAEHSSTNPADDNHWHWFREWSVRNVNIPAEGTATGTLDTSRVSDNYSEKNIQYIYWMPVNTPHFESSHEDLFENEDPPTLPPNPPTSLAERGEPGGAGDGLTPEEQTTLGMAQRLVGSEALVLPISDTAPSVPLPDIGYQNPYGVLWGSIWEDFKAWDNDEVAENYENLQATGHGKIASGLIAFLGALGERNGMGEVENARSGQNKAGEYLTPGQRVVDGAIGATQTVLNAVGLRMIPGATRRAAKGLKVAATRGAVLLREGTEEALENLGKIKKYLLQKSDSATKNTVNAPKPRKVPPTPQPSSLVPSGSKRLGDWGEARLKALLDGAGEVPKGYYTTSWGRRKFDRLVDGIAHESKAGVNVKLNQSIVNQVMKDKELIDDGIINGSHWHFWQGADPELLEFLDLHGIKHTVH